MDNTENQQEIKEMSLFSAPIYKISKPEFLKTARKVSKKFVAKRKKEVELNHAYPVYMTENLNYDPEMHDFANYVAQAGWDILASQGYAMQNLGTFFTSMWCQEHHNMSLMERHIHGEGNLLTGFYFLDCPKNSSKIIFHDPRDAKVITSLPQQNEQEVTYSSNLVNFTPEEGDIYFSNSYLPHSFTKNLASKPMRFIHFNIAVHPVEGSNVCTQSQAEVV